MMRTIEAFVQRLASGTQTKGIKDDQRISSKEMAAFGEGHARKQPKGGGMK
jgi:hypothetical protein